MLEPNVNIIVRILSGILFAPAGVILYGGSLLVWPIYQRTRRKWTRRGRALFRVFIVQMVLYVLWGAVLCISALNNGDAIHGIGLYLFLNLVFLCVYWQVWKSSNEADISSDVRSAG